MSTISTSPRRPSNATSTPSRMPYEAGEALLWERQNARVHTHLALQMKDLQSAHDAYNARIQATEAVAEAAEAAVHRLKLMEAKIAAIEEDERDRPFDAWVKEAVGQLQVAVDGMKGVRQKLSGIEQEVGKLGEDVEGVRDVGGLLRSVIRRLEVLEGEKGKEGRRVQELEREVTKLKSHGQHQEEMQDGMENKVYDDLPADDNPLAVFYGIDTQSPSKQRGPSRQNNNEDRLDSRARSRTVSTQRCPQPRLTDSLRESGDLLPPDEEIMHPVEDDLELLETTPQTPCGFENTQQFKSMQKELEMLRAMCRSQEIKGSNETTQATQPPQDTLVLPRETGVGLSDATTEPEADFPDAGRHRSPMRAARGSVGALSSDIQLPSSPPRRQNTQSARRNLMKRPSIYDPRVPSQNEYRQPERSTPDVTVESDRQRHPPLMVRIPVNTQLVNDRVPAKRKRDDDGPTQRVTRPKLTNDRPTARKASAAKKPVVPAAKAKDVVEKTAFTQPAPLASSDDATALPSPNCRTYGKQKPAVNRLVQQSTPQTSPIKSKQPAAPVAQSAVSATEAVKSRKTASKTRLAAKAPVQEQAPSEAGPSSPKKAPAAVKSEGKGPRQPAGACKSCRSRHQKCDRTHPVCGRCAKSGTPCEYPQASGSTAPTTTAPATSPRKKQVLLPVKKPAAKDAGREHDLGGQSATAGPEAPHHKSPAKRLMPTSPSKKPAVATPPTAASTRAPRAKGPKTFPKKQN